MSKITRNLFWNPSQLLSYNRIFNIAIGSRGCGKTFSCKLWCISDFIKTGSQFIYLRRTDVELKMSKDSFFRDVVKEGYFPEHEFKIDGNLYYINNKLAGFAYALSTGTTRSISFPDVNKILFDEFIHDARMKGGQIRDEAGLFVNFYETVDRARDEVRVLMLSNSHSVVNPYFSKWKVRIQKGAIFTKVGSEIVVEVVNNVAFKEAKKKTRFGQFLSGTDEGRHIIDNDFTNDNTAFVEKIRGEKRNYLCTIINGKDKVGVWYYLELGLLFCSEQTEDCNYCFAFTTFDQQPNVMMLKSIRTNSIIKNMVEAVEYGTIRYSNLSVKNTILEVLGML